MIVIYEESKKIFEACQTAVQPSQPAEASWERSSTVRFL